MNTLCLLYQIYSASIYFSIINLGPGFARGKHFNYCWYINTVIRILSNHHINLYNTKLLSSCLKQILTLGVITTTVTNTPKEAEEAGWGRGGQGDCGNNTIAKSLFDRKMKDGCLNKLVITEYSHQATQFKKSIMFCQSYA